jgi:hypothetical protein
MGNHVPVDRHLLRYDLANSSVATVRCRDGYPHDVLLFSGEQMGLVLEPSLVFTREREGSKQLTWVGFDRAISIEFNRGSTQEVRWVRDPNGLWIVLTDLGQ